jgi:hypothetical protein
MGGVPRDHEFANPLLRRISREINYANSLIAMAPPASAD